MRPDSHSMDRCDSGCRSRRKKKRSRKVEGSESGVSCCRSFIAAEGSVSGKPDQSERGIRPDAKITSHHGPKGHRVQRSENRHDLKMQDNSAQRPLSRYGTPVKREKEPSSPNQTKEKRRRNDFHLPELVLPNKHKNSVDILRGWNQDGLLPEPQYIRQTRSGIAYQFVIKPPRWLPRIVSEGAIKKRDSNTALDLDQIALLGPSPTLPDGLGFQKIPKCHSGERFTNSIRYAAELGRQKREKKNLNKNRTKFQEQEDRSSRMGNNYEDTATRVREVRAKQDAIREQEKIRMMEKFIKQKRKH